MSGSGCQHVHMTIDDVDGTGIPTDPWHLTTPPGKSEFEAYRDPDADPPVIEGIAFRGPAALPVIRPIRRGGCALSGRGVSWFRRV